MLRSALRLIALASVVGAPLAAQDLLSHARELQRRGDLDSAYEVIQRAADAAPTRADVWYALGDIAGDRAQRMGGGLRAYGTARKCKQGFARAVELAPDSIPYLEALMSYLYQAPGIVGGDKDSALALARHVRRLDEVRGIQDEVTVLRTGNDRRKQQADSLLDWWSGQHPGDRRIQFIAANLFAQSRPEKALAIDERLLARDSGDFAARFGVARNLVVLKRDPERALRLLRTLSGRTPPDSPAPRWTPEAVPWRMGQAFLQLGKPDSARAYYEEALRMNAAFQPAQRSLDSLSRR